MWGLVTDMVRNLPLWGNVVGYTPRGVPNQIPYWSVDLSPKFISRDIARPFSLLNGSRGFLAVLRSSTESFQGFKNCNSVIVGSSEIVIFHLINARHSLSKKVQRAMTAQQFATVRLFISKTSHLLRIRALPHRLGQRLHFCGLVPES